MNIYNDLEHACQTLKHTPENIDPTELRSLLRQTQHIIDSLTPLLTPHTLTIQQTNNDGYLEYTVNLTTTLDNTEYHNLLQLISEQ